MCIQPHRASHKGNHMIREHDNKVQHVIKGFTRDEKMVAGERESWGKENRD